MLDLSKISPTQFEEFCFDLLVALGALNVSWRKGSNQDASPADQGRDIQCDWEITEIGGQKHRETWFIECKHHKDAISPDKLQSAFAWAGAESPDVLLIAASGFLSNPTKNHIDARTRNVGSTYRIRVWENKDFERMAARYPSILRKYQIVLDLRFFEFMHPVHLEFLRKPPINTLEYFFTILDQCDLSFRREAFGMAFLAIINPRSREPEDIEHQTIGELFDRPVGYVEFKKKCRELAFSVYEGFLVNSFVYDALRWAFSRADPTALEEQRLFFEGVIKLAENEVLIGTDSPEGTRSMVAHAKEMQQNVGSKLDQNIDFYFNLCENVVAKLFKEPPRQIPDSVGDQFKRRKQKADQGT